MNFKAACLYGIDNKTDGYLFACAKGRLFGKPLLKRGLFFNGSILKND